MRVLDRLSDHLDHTSETRSSGQSMGSDALVRGEPRARRLTEASGTPQPNDFQVTHAERRGD